MSNAFRWLFEDRTTGKIVVAQMPNLALWVFIAATALSFVVKTDSRIGVAVHIVEVASLAVWALDEVFRGVNPWRRILGVVVIILGAYLWLPR